LPMMVKVEDGRKMDYPVAGIEVDCKFSARLGGWMLPREAYLKGHLCLVIWADEDYNRFEAGLVRAIPRSPRLAADAEDDLLGPENQDRKRTLTPWGESRIRWLYSSPKLPENLLLHIDAATRNRILTATSPGRRTRSGQAKINMLSRLVQRQLVNRGSVLTVGQQKDAPKRARDARKHKAHEAPGRRRGASGTRFGSRAELTPQRTALPQRAGPHVSQMGRGGATGAACLMPCPPARTSAGS
jgi:hypothetical protein